MDGDRGAATTLPNREHGFFGLCSGTTAVYGDATPTHCVGVRWTTASSNAGNTYGIKPLPTVNVGGATTDGTQFAVASYYHNQSATESGTHPLIIEITKGSPNYSLRILSKQASGFIDTSLATMVGVVNMNTPVLANFTWAAAQTVAVDEAANGTLNAVCFYWAEDVYNMEVSDILVLKMS
jgi:hypothetical protein